MFALSLWELLQTEPVYPTLKTICQWEIIKYTNKSYTISPDGKLNEQFLSKCGRQRNIIITFNNVQMADRRRGGLVVERRTPEREVGGSILTQVAVLCPSARYIYLPIVLVIHRKRWLRPDMTGKLLTGTLSKNETKNKRLISLLKLTPMAVNRDLQQKYRHDTVIHKHIYFRKHTFKQ